VASNAALLRKQASGDSETPQHLEELRLATKAASAKAQDLACEAIDVA
jgi:hypothetical protein